MYSSKFLFQIYKNLRTIAHIMIKHLLVLTSYEAYRARAHTMSASRITSSTTPNQRQKMGNVIIIIAASTC